MVATLASSRLLKSHAKLGAAGCVDECSRFVLYAWRSSDECNKAAQNEIVKRKQHVVYEDLTHLTSFRRRLGRASPHRTLAKTWREYSSAYFLSSRRWV